jgi:integrase
MGIYTRPNSPYYWKRYDTDPTTGKPLRPRASTKIHVDGVTKAQRDQNKVDAEHQYMQDCIDIRQGVFAPAALKPATFGTYRAWIEQHYLSTFTIKHGGRDKEESMLRRLVREFGSLTIDAFTVDRVVEYQDRRAQDVKASTVIREISVLKATLRRWAKRLRNDGCAAPDVRDILPDLMKLKTKQTIARWFNEAEFARFIAAINAHDSIRGIPRVEGLAMATTAVETLLRRSSLLKLEWSHFRGTFFTPLDAKVRIDRSPASSNLRQYLNALPKSTDRVFASFDRTYRRAKARGLIMSDTRRQQAAANAADRWFREVCRLAELPLGRPYGLTFHSFRHTGATWYLNGTTNRQPVSVSTVMAMGGWQNVRVFVKTYCHTDIREQDRAAESLFPNGLPGLPKLTLVADAQTRASEAS